MSKRVRRWRSPKRLLVGGMILLLAWLAVREIFNPSLTLFIDDVLFPKPAPQVMTLTPQTTLRLYTDTRPHVGKIDELQKGLILVHEGKRLVEEGYGFGLPLIVAGGVSYNTRHAEVLSPAPDTLVKRYVMDTVDRPVRPLRRKYQPVAPIGTVIVTYTVRPPALISVTVDVTGLPPTWDAVYMMNEQGARAFTHYRDPTGQTWSSEDVGIWRQTKAPFGCWEAPEHGVRFCVDAKDGQSGFIGRERYNQYNWLGLYTLSWSGIDLEIEAPQDTFTYAIRVERYPDVP